MSDNRLPDYLGHMQQAATDACGFVEGLTKEDFKVIGSKSAGSGQSTK